MEIRALVLPYPNFVLGAIIDPEEANENNYEISERVNDVYEYLMAFSAGDVKMTTNIEEISGADLHSFLISFKDFVDAKVLSLQNQVTSNDVDITALQNLSTNLQNQITSNKADIESQLNTHKVSIDHDVRYYTKDELSPFLRGGDTIIKEEIFTIINSDNGDGTFSYDKNGSVVVGQLSAEGYQIFTLTDGNYELGLNRVEIIINDTLRRSVKSGGLVEIDEINVALTSVEGSGAEITIKYYERIGVATEYTIKLNSVKPLSNNGQNMWFKIIG